MDTRVEPLSAILRLNARLLINCLDGLTDEVARVRHAEGANSVTFIAAHVTDTRFFMLRTLGGLLDNPLAVSFDKVKRIDDVTNWPTLDTIRAAWIDVSAAIDSQLQDATDDDLSAPVDRQFPGVERTRLGALTFLVQHDSYHIGQVALLRKPAGLPAMTYRL